MNIYTSVDNTISVAYQEGQFHSMFLHDECDKVSFDYLKSTLPFYEDELDKDVFKLLKR